MKDKYGAFIIESLNEGEYFDGKILKGILKQSNVMVQYKQVSDRNELGIELARFSKSGFRYLHISCHATKETLNLSHETIWYREFEQLIADKVKNKRVFLSACDAGNDDFASMIIRNGGYSVIGSSIPLRFDKAALFWASFFHIMTELDQDKMTELDQHKMKRKDIKWVLKRCVGIFDIPINYYSFIKSSSNSKMRRVRIMPDQMDNRIINLTPINE
jgi:hypothetical protein